MDAKNLKKPTQTNIEKDRGDILKKGSTNQGKNLAKMVKLTHRDGDAERKALKVDKLNEIIIKKPFDVKSRSVELTPIAIARKNIEGASSKDTADEGKVTTVRNRENLKLNAVNFISKDPLTKNSKKAHPEHGFKEISIKASDATNRIRSNMANARSILSKQFESVKISAVSKENLAKFTDRKPFDHMKTAYKLSERNEAKNKIDTEERKKIRKKYTLKFKNPIIPDEKSVAPYNTFTEVKTDLSLKIPDPQQSLESPANSKPSTIETKSIKAVIRTNTPKNNKFGKPFAVDDHKTINTHKNLNESRKFKSKPYILNRVKNSETECSVPSKPIKAGFRKEKTHRLISPEASAKVKSPPTEVAKWNPLSVNRYTKPYYEAWVNTRLAAIPKDTNLSFKELQTELRREKAEYENYKDELYIGRIRINRR